LAGNKGLAFVAGLLHLRFEFKDLVAGDEMAFL
jgi:hypothetical protein